MQCRAAPQLLHYSLPCAQRDCVRIALKPCSAGIISFLSHAFVGLSKQIRRMRTSMTPIQAATAKATLPKQVSGSQSKHARLRVVRFLTLLHLKGEQRGFLLCKRKRVLPRHICLHRSKRNSQPAQLPKGTVSVGNTAK